MTTDEARLRRPTDMLYSDRVVEPISSMTQPGSASRYLRLGILLIPIVVLGALFLVGSGLAAPGRRSQTPWELSILVLSFLVTLAMSVAVAREMPRLYDRATGVGIDRADAAIELGTLVVTTPIALALGLAAFAGWAGVFDLVGLSTFTLPTVLAGVAIVVATLPVAIFSGRRARRTRRIEERFPDLLRDLNEAQSAGLTMAQAVRVAAKGDYGALGPEVRRMADQISWGTSFPAAFQMFSERIGTPLVHRAVSLVNKATRAGGNVRDVLAAAARDAREIKTLEAERRGQMLLYVIVIYVAFGVFLAVTAALQGLFIPAILSSTRATGAGFGSIGINTKLDLEDFHFIYYGVGLVQAIGSGILAGVMSEGTLQAGLKHTAILVGVTVVVLGVLL